METALFKITFSDGRMFKVICMNKAQKNRLYATGHVIKKHDQNVKVDLLEAGIHDVAQWEKIITKL